MFLLPSTETTYEQLEGFAPRPAAAPRELPEPVLVRNATAADERRVRVLARLDDRKYPAGPHLVAELSGEIVAALSLTSGAVVADPFRRTREASDLLRLRAAQIAQHDETGIARQQRTALAPAAA